MSTHTIILAIPDLTKATALQYIGDYAFAGGLYAATGGQTLNIPSTVQYLGYGSFNYQRTIGTSGKIWAAVNIGSENSPSQLTSVGYGENFACNSGRSHGTWTAYGITDEALKQQIASTWLGWFDNVYWK